MALVVVSADLIQLSVKVDGVAMHETVQARSADEVLNTLRSWLRPYSGEVDVVVRLPQERIVSLRSSQRYLALYFAAITLEGVVAGPARSSRQSGIVPRAAQRFVAAR